MRELFTYGSIEGGKLKISYRDRFYEALKHWPNGRVSITVKRLYRQRSLMQNAYLHGVVIPEMIE